MLCASGDRTGYIEASFRPTRSSAEVAERGWGYDSWVRDVPHPITGQEDIQRGVEEGNEERSGRSRYSNLARCHHNVSTRHCAATETFCFSQVRTLWCVTRGTSCAMHRPTFPKQ